jgi:hypothetical protein
MLMRMLSILPVLFLCLPPAADGQRSFSDSSRLSDPAYVREKIREISDGDLWGAVDLDRPGLEKVREAVRGGNLRLAAAAWEAYWRGKRQPCYVTQTDHLLLDTDMLTDTASFCHAMNGSPDERDTILARAAMMLQNAIRPWGDTVLQFARRVDFDTDVGQSGKYGFHYWMWSRPLVMAYLLTRDETYLAKFDSFFNDWFEQRNSIHSGIPGLDVVYYELGLGMRNRMFIEDYLLPCSTRSAETHVRMLKTFLAAGRWLYQLERWEGYRPGNWQTHGSYMLVQLTLVFPEFREASAWLSIGLERLSQHLKDDFYADGGHSERAPRNYTQATYLNYRNVAYLLDAYGARTDLAGMIRASLGRTIDWWISMITPTGEIPAINDSQRGLFPASILRDGARLFHRPQAYAVLRTLLGDTTAPAGPLPAYTSRHMPASGFSVMRSDWTREGLYLTLNYGPAAGFHTHFDMLDFEIYAYGRPLAVDAGIGLTYDDTLYNTWYRSSRAHNMVTVNDRNIEREGTEGKRVHWGSTTTVDFFSGEHDGYRRFGTKVRRQIAFVKPSYWFCLDEISSGRDGDTLSWYFHSSGQLAAAGDGFSSVSAPGIRLIPAGSHYATRTGVGWAASTTVKIPGKTEKIPWVRFDQISVRDRTHRFAVLLLPFRTRDGTASAAKVSDRHYLVTTPGWSDHLYFTGGPFSDDTLQTDGEFAFVRVPAHGPPVCVLIDGTYLIFAGKKVVASSTPASVECEIVP